MYARDVRAGDETKKLTFAVSGMLWNRSLVMIDTQTNTQWSHLLGKAMRGPLEGTKLKRLPGLMTDWNTWRSKHPDTTVVTLKRTSRDYLTQFYERPQSFVVGFARGEDAKAWPFDQLIKQPVVNDVVNKLPLVVVFDEASSTGFIYDRRLEGQVLKFRGTNEGLIDEQTNSKWNVETGTATAGPLNGKQLKPLAGIVSFRDTWKVFHPDTEEFSER